MPPYREKKKLFIVRLKDFVTLEKNSERYAKYGDKYIRNIDSKDYFYTDVDNATKFTSMRTALLARDLYFTDTEFNFEDVVHIYAD